MGQFIDLKNKKFGKLTVIERAPASNEKEAMWKCQCDVGMRQRCYLKTHNRYQRYGGRGIRVCPEWEDYTIFKKWAMSNGYNPNAKRGSCTIDRIDVNGNYEPSNCRWVDAKVQAQNKEKN